jgi:hypothetical protein
MVTYSYPPARSGRPAPRVVRDRQWVVVVAMVIATAWIVVGLTLVLT